MASSLSEEKNREQRFYWRGRETRDAVAANRAKCRGWTHYISRPRWRPGLRLSRVVSLQCFADDASAKPFVDGTDGDGRRLIVISLYGRR